MQLTIILLLERVHVEVVRGPALALVVSLFGVLLHMNTKYDNNYNNKDVTLITLITVPLERVHVGVVGGLIALALVVSLFGGLPHMNTKYDNNYNNKDVTLITIIKVPLERVHVGVVGSLVALALVVSLLRVLVGRRQVADLDVLVGQKGEKLLIVGALQINEADATRDETKT